jgi:multidrug efflux system outer membrane protein
MMKKHLLTLAVMAALSGCSYFTSNEPPEITAAQTAWEKGAPKAASATETKENAAWWRSFHDPVLDGLIADAQARNLDLKIAAERVLEARALRHSARAAWLPNITGVADVSEANVFGPGSNNSRATVGAQIGWEPDITGRLTAIAQGASADARAAEADAELVRLALYAEVANTYVNYRLQQNLSTLTQENASLQQKTQDITNLRFKNGLGSELDVQRGIALLAQTRSDSAVAKEAAAAARMQLVYLLATTPEELTPRIQEERKIPVADPLQVLLSPADVLARRQDVKAARERYASAVAGRDEADALRLPNLTLSGLLGLDAAGVTRLVDGSEVVRTASASLLAPIFDFGRLAANAEASDSRRRQAALDYERVVRKALQETQTALVSYTQSLVRKRELTRASNAATQAATLAGRQFGRTTVPRGRYFPA